MSEGGYDAIVIGARCAGSPTAMLLANRGYRVLLVDKATFPSDTMSTHVIHPPALAALKRWGLLEQLDATHCPPIETYSFDFGPVSIKGSPQPVEGISHAYCPRRTVLDKLLVDGAVAAGAELREAFMVEDLVSDGDVITGIRGHAKGGSTVTEHAKVVVGADGKHSLLAKTVNPEQYNQRPPALAQYYAYWSGLDIDGFEIRIRSEHRRGWAAAPTHDDLVVLPFGWPIEEFKANRRDVEGNFFAAMDLIPEFAERIRDAKRESKFFGTAENPFYFRKPFGPGWVLLGDAGYHKDPITAMGINDAWRDAELVAGALDDYFSGRRSFDDGMADYQRTRDEAAMPVYDFTWDIAQMQPPPPDQQQLFGAIAGNQEAMDGFVSVQANTLPAPQFFAPENVARIMAAAAAPAAPAAPAQ